MKIEFETGEVLSDREIKEVAKVTVSDVIRQYLTGSDGQMASENNMQRLITNHAYQLVFDEINSIVPDYKDRLVKGTVDQINKENFAFYIWKKKDVWDREEGYGWKIAQEEMKKHENTIREKIRDAVQNYDYERMVLEKTGEQLGEISSCFYSMSEAIIEMTEKHNDK